jgi:hypothetical protein
MKSFFKWRKLGQIFSPSGTQEWLSSHAQNPTPLVYSDRIRVFFNGRPKPQSDGQNVSWATYIDLDIDNPLNIIAYPSSPILELGKTGTFDEFGVMAGAVIRQSEQHVWLYYVGWSRCLGVPYNHAIGIAVSHDGGRSFTRMGEGPVITRTLNEPYIQNSPFILKQDAVYHLWYSSGISWKHDAQKPESIYVLMHATSTDGIHWNRSGKPMMPYQVSDECQTNPCVIEINGRYHLWFCYRHGLGFRNAERGYRMGYAWSDDLHTWHRDDAVGALLPSENGWDSQMICYPSVFRTPSGATYMLYSGNDFGRSGFGIAILES